MSKEYFIRLTPGKLMGLKQITDTDNRFRVLALDQSNSFKKSLRAMHERLKNPQEPAYEEIRDAKMEMTSILGEHATAVLLDVNYGARQAINSWSLPKGVGLIVRLEASKDPGLPGEVEKGFGVEKIKRMGASAVKLLVYLDVEDSPNAQAQMDFVRTVAGDCRKHDILLMIEELSYPRAGEDKKSPSYLARRPKNILEAARLIGPYADVLKLEYPGEEHVAELNRIASKPWVLLSAGEKFDIFIKYAESAMKAGASGYMAGRAIFNEYFEGRDPAQRTQFLMTTGVERMKLLNGFVGRHAIPWNRRYGIRAEEMSEAFSRDWYLDGAQVQDRPVGASSRGDY